MERGFPRLAKCLTVFRSKSVEILMALSLPPCTRSEQPFWSLGRGPISLWNIIPTFMLLALLGMERCWTLTRLLLAGPGGIFLIGMPRQWLQVIQSGSLHGRMSATAFRDATSMVRVSLSMATFWTQMGSRSL